MDSGPACILAVNASAQWAVYALGAVTILYVIFRPSLQRKKKDPLADAAPRLSLAQQRSVERQMQNLLVELAEMARQITAQIDTRAARLEALMQDADEKIAQLQRLSLAAPPPPRREPTEVPRIAPEPELQPPPAARPRREDRYGEIYAMADEGESPAEIARRLGRPRGEVELILALRAPA